MSNSDKDLMEDEYDLNSLGAPTRGKYAKRYREGTNVVVIDPDLTERFPDAGAVNKALRKLLDQEQPDAT